MDYKIVEKNALKVIGVNKKMITMNNEHWRDIPKFWNEFEESGIQEKFKSYAVDDNVFAITTYTDELESFGYMIAVPYNGTENKDNYDVLTIPSGTYAVFEVPSEAEGDVGSFTMRIFNEWLPTTGYKLTGGAEIECMTKKGTVIWLPIDE